MVRPLVVTEDLLSRGAGPDRTVRSLTDWISLPRAIAQIGANPVTIMIDSIELLAADLTIPANVRLWFVQDGRIQIAPDCTLTLASPAQIEAGDRQRIFEGIVLLAHVTGVVTCTGPGTVHPAWWGAVADAVTDDAEAIQAAATALAGGGIVKITADHWIEDTIALPDHVALEGMAGWRGILRSDMNKVFVLLGDEGACRRMHLIGSGDSDDASETGVATVDSVSHPVIEGCLIEDMGYDGIFNGGDDVEDMVIRDNVILGCQDDGINPAAGTTGPLRTRIENNYIDSIRNTGIHISINSEETLVRGNVIRRCGNGIDFHTTAGGCSIIGNLIEDIDGAGPATDGFGIGVTSGDTAHRLLIAGNRIARTIVEGIRIRFGSQEVVIADNIIEDSQSHGMWLANGENYDADIAVTGNTVTSSYDVFGILVENPNSVTLVGNILRLTNESAANYGIKVLGASEILIAANQVHGGARNIYVVSAGAEILTVQGNICTAPIQDWSIIIDGPATGTVAPHLIVADNNFPANKKLTLKGVTGAIVTGNRSGSIEELNDADGNHYHDNVVAAWVTIAGASIINHCVAESANAEEPAGTYPIGTVVDFIDTGDASGNGVYLLLKDASWSKIGT